MRQKRILAVSSGGGHWVQLLRLRPAFAGQHVAYVTVRRGYRSDVDPAPFYVVPDATRETRFKLWWLAARMALVLLRERPNVIITTGAAPGFFAVRFGRLFGARTIWLDSIANVDELSLSGRLAGPYADLWLTQWSHLADTDRPQYAGEVV